MFWATAPFSSHLFHLKTTTVACINRSTGDDDDDDGDDGNENDDDDNGNDENLPTLSTPELRQWFEPTEVQVKMMMMLSGRSR